MELYQLQVFVTVADRNSFSKAAEQLFLTQPTVSAHIKNLEKELGIELFDRGKHGFRLTKSARSLYRYAQDMLSLRDLAKEELSSGSLMQNEVLTIAASSVPCQYLLPQAVSAFEHMYPGVTVLLQQENSRSVCENIIQYDHQLGIVGERCSFPKLSHIPLIADELVAAIPCSEEYEGLLKKDKLAFSDLSGYKLLLREPGSGTRALLEASLISSGLELDMLNIAVFNNQETIKQSVRHGLGISIISRYVVADYCRFNYVAARRLADLELRREFCLVYHDRRVLSLAANAFKEFLINYSWIINN